MSREMQAPINAMIGYCDIIVDHGEQKTVSDAAGKMTFAARQLQEFLDNLSKLVGREDGASETSNKDILPPVMPEDVVKLTAS